MWRKSSYSASNGNCLEADDWRKSLHSNPNGECVEVGSGIQVRDSNDTDGPVLRFNPDAWKAFTAGIQAV